MTVFIMHGCSETAPPQINCAYEGNASIVYNDMECEGHISYVNANTASVSISSPETLKGIKFSRSDGSCTLSLDNLLCKSGCRLTNKNSFEGCLFSAFDSINSGGLTLKGEKNGVYTFVSADSNITCDTDNNGKLLSVKTPDIEIKTME